MSLPSRVLFSANDPGGANAIAPVIRALYASGTSVQGILTGPACAIFALESIPFIDAAGLDEAALGQAVAAFAPDAFVSGTSGGQASVDKRILLLLKKRVPSLYVLDFWSNYWQRFSGETKDFTYLPDKICVMDEAAKRDMLEQGFPEYTVVATGNPYFEEFAQGIRKEGDPYTILFISQPLSTDTEIERSQYGFTEYLALQGLLTALERLPQEYVCSLRLHPREPANKYEEFLSGRVTRAAEPTLEEALSRAGIVVGMFSPVLMQAAVAGKPVISFEPGMDETHDPLPTNRLGITRRCTSEATLSEALQKYANNTYSGGAVALSSIWPPGAQQRILAELSLLCEDWQPVTL